MGKNSEIKRHLKWRRKEKRDEGGNEEKYLKRKTARWGILWSGEVRTYEEEVTDSKKKGGVKEQWEEGRKKETCKSKTIWTQESKQNLRIKYGEKE